MTTTRAYCDYCKKEIPGLPRGMKPNALCQITMSLQIYREKTLSYTQMTLVIEPPPDFVSDICTACFMKALWDYVRQNPLK